MSGFLEWLKSDTAELVSVCMVILCSVITLHNVILHLANYSRDDLQRHITRIVLVVPIFTIASWLEITHPGLAIYCQGVVAFWEALVIYSFFNLILEYVGGEHNWLVCVQHTHPEGVKHMWPFNWCFPKPMDLDPSWLRNCKLACFQFVFVKPLTAIVFLPFLFAGIYDDPPWPLIRDIIYNITYTVAMYALALLYMTTHEHPSLKPKRPLAKFATVKLVIFFTYWQKYFLIFFNLSDHDMANVLAFLTMIEMTLVAIPINWIAFPWREFQTGIVDASNMVEMLETGASSPSDKVRSGVNRFNSVMKNASKIFSTDDFVDNASHNFGSKYKTHVLLESSQEYVIEDNPIGADASTSPIDKPRKKKKVFKAKTYLIGGLSPVSDISPASSARRGSADSSPSEPSMKPQVLGQRAQPSSPRSPAQTAPKIVPPLPLPPKAKSSAVGPPAYVILDEEVEDVNGEISKE
jgi:hypothetical protein